MKRIILTLLTFSLIGCGSSSNEAQATNDDKILAEQPRAITKAAVSQTPVVNTDDLKMKTVRSMYDDLQAGNDLPSIFDKYGERDLQSVSELATAKASTAEQMYELGISDCDEVGWELNLLPTQDLDIQDIIEVDYRVLKNGNVRASIITDPYNKDVDSREFDVYKDYALNCAESDCKVTDIVGADGISTKSEIRKYCR